MASTKKAKSKFIAENDFLNENGQNKKGLKRQSDELDASDFISQYPNSKKKKLDVNPESSKIYRQKVITTMSNQLEERKQRDNRFLKSLTDLLGQLEADYNSIKENAQKAEQLTGAVMKFILQASDAHKQKVQTLKDILISFKKQVEGLLTRGAMKPDDRPLWFDIYKAFPPAVEPKFARPKPEMKPIRQIFYQEDIIRAKFHAKGHGLGVVNLLNPNLETQTKRLLDQYKKLKSEGVSEEELIEKSVAAVETESQLEVPKTPKIANHESVTTQVLAEADIKNIFKE